MFLVSHTSKWKALKQDNGGKDDVKIIYRWIQAKKVELRKAGKSSANIMNEHGVSRTSIQTWEKQYDNSGKFTVKDNLSESEKELRLLRKENK